MSIPARYSGVCPECGGLWQPGDLIRSVVVGPEHFERWFHDTCPTTYDPTTVNPGEQVCTDCWLIHPKGACDR